MNDIFAYLLLDISLLLVWALIYFSRADLRHKMWKISFVGGFCGLLAEFWYYTDYWQPPVLFGIQSISLEDYVFGFTILGLSITIFDFVMRKKNDSIPVPFTLSRQNLLNIARNWLTKPKHRILLLLFLIGLFSLIVLNTILKVPSIIVSSIAFLASSGIIFIIRKDLIRQSLLTGLFLVLLVLPVYILLFDVLFPSFWDKYWLLSGTPIGIFLIGNIPWTELFWYFSLGTLMGGAYEFYKGYKKVDL
ncbi:MAG: lycopene cyclase domain-containing protein [Patescibacteria group bacterium]